MSAEDVAEARIIDDGQTELIGRDHRYYFGPVWETPSGLFIFHKDEPIQVKHIENYHYVESQRSQI